MPLTRGIQTFSRRHEKAFYCLSPKDKFDAVTARDGFAAVAGKITGDATAPHTRCFCSECLRRPGLGSETGSYEDVAEGRRFQGPKSLASRIFVSLNKSPVRVCDREVLEPERKRKTKKSATTTVCDGAKPEGVGRNSGQRLFDEETKRPKAGGDPEAAPLPKGIGCLANPWPKQNQTRKIRLYPVLAGANKISRVTRRVRKVVNLADYPDLKSAQKAAEALLQDMFPRPDYYIDQAVRNAGEKRRSMRRNGTVPKFGRPKLPKIQKTSNSQQQQI